MIWKWWRTQEYDLPHPDLPDLDKLFRYNNEHYFDNKLEHSKITYRYVPIRRLEHNRYSGIKAQDMVRAIQSNPNYHRFSDGWNSSSVVCFAEVAFDRWNGCVPFPTRLWRKENIFPDPYPCDIRIANCLPLEGVSASFLHELAHVKANVDGPDIPNRDGHGPSFWRVLEELKLRGIGWASNEIQRYRDEWIRKKWFVANDVSFIGCRCGPSSDFTVTING